VTDIADSLRRIITADDETARSFILIDGPPSAASGTLETGGLFEIWADAATGRLDPQTLQQLSPATAVLAPSPGQVKVRWFLIHPAPPGVPHAELVAQTRARFAQFDAEDHLTDQDRHPAMHRTESLDVICLLKGEADLVLDSTETRIRPGQVVIQRGTSHAWRAVSGPALFLAVLIDRPAPEPDRQGAPS
jgi:mannose-6-phosphate isomerase-like protein (cupin superfamily)